MCFFLQEFDKIGSFYNLDDTMASLSSNFHPKFFQFLQENCWIKLQTQSRGFTIQEIKLNRPIEEEEKGPIPVLSLSLPQSLTKTEGQTEAS